MSAETFTLEMAAKGALISVAALCLAASLRRAPAAGRHLLLALAAAVLLALPALMTALPSREMAVLPPDLGANLEGGAGLAPARKGEGGRYVDVDRRSPTHRGGDKPLPSFELARIGVGIEGFAVLGLAVSALLLARLLVAMRRLSGLRAAARPAPREWRELLADCRQRLAIARPVRLGVSAALAVPVTFGWLRPVVLLPEAARGWTGEQLGEVLLHELAHVRRHDWPVQMTARAACALHWFNPMVWLLSRRLLLEAELACDDQVLRAGTGATGYAERLVALAREVRDAARRPAEAMAFARPSGLASRVTAILDPERRRGGPGRLTAAGAAVAALTLLVLVAPARLVRAEPEAPLLRSDLPVQDLPPLHRAASEGNAAEVRRLLAAGADPGQAVPRLGTPLILAAERGHLEVVEALLAAGADENAIVAGNGTALTAAARGGDPRVVRRLLDAGAEPNVYVSGDETALQQAVENGHAEAARVLLAAWASPLTEERRRKAVRQGIEGGIQGGIEEGVEGGVQEGVAGGVEDGVAGGIEGAVEGGVQGGIAQGVEEGRNEALLEAAAEGDLEAVRFLLDAGADPNVQISTHTPLRMARRGGHQAVERLLRERGARE